MGPRVLQSHTATRQWQSFEARMRRRRVERCALRASAAIDAGVLDDAREALEEIQRLDPYEPSIQTLRAALARAETRAPEVLAESSAPALSRVEPLGDIALIRPLPAAPASDSPIPQIVAIEAPRRGRAAGYVMAATLVAISAAGGWWWVAGPPLVPAALTSVVPVAIEKPEAASSLPAAPVGEPAVRIDKTNVSAAATGDPPAAATAGVATSGAVVPVLTPEARTATVAVPDSPLRAMDPAAGSSVPASSPVVEAAPPPPVDRPRPLPAVEPSPSLPDAPPVTPVAVSGADSVSLADTTVTLAPPPAAPAAVGTTSTPATSSPPTAPSQSDERFVRAALGRYEAAYSALDAAAASKVWPGVDQRALASAFQALSSQSVSLGRCEVRINGATAQAECRGTARWNPKVGGGPQTASRQWRFELRNASGDWIITRATVR